MRPLAMTVWGGALGGSSGNVSLRAENKFVVEDKGNQKKKGWKESQGVKVFIVSYAASGFVKHGKIMTRTLLVVCLV